MEYRTLYLNNRGTRFVVRDRKGRNQPHTWKTTAGREITRRPKLWEQHGYDAAAHVSVNGKPALFWYAEIVPDPAEILTVYTDPVPGLETGKIIFHVTRHTIKAGRRCTIRTATPEIFIGSLPEGINAIPINTAGYYSKANQQDSRLHQIMYQLQNARSIAEARKKLSEAGYNEEPAYLIELEAEIIIINHRKATEAQK